MKKILLTSIITSLFLLSGCGEKSPEGASEQNTIETANVYKVQKQQVPDFYETSGTVKAKNSAEVASKLMARVVSVNFKEGDFVKKGQLLVKLEDSDIIAGLNSAQASYNEAHNALGIAEQNKNLSAVTYQRYKNIYEQKALTKQELDEVATKKNIAVLEYNRAIDNINKTSAYVAEAKTNLSYAHITAPISGIISNKFVDVGDMATPGQRLFTIKSPNLEISSQVDESLINLVKKGETVEVSVPNSDKTFSSVITEVVNSIDEDSRTFQIKTTVQNGDLRDGQYVKVFIPKGQKETVLVNSSAIVAKGQLEGVYILNPQNEVSFRLAKTGKSFNGKTEILSGLEDGDILLIEHEGMIEEGFKVKDINFVE